VTENAPLALYRFWITDERTGKSRLTRFHLTEADARERVRECERKAVMRLRAEVRAR
jgi:hypothetical protein